ncbi:MAG: hypothetical protein RLZZ361_1315 [Cyanobacteriota bacterium]|jgi:uncharacterized protein (UPF0333 family)
MIFVLCSALIIAISVTVIFYFMVKYENHRDKLKAQAEANKDLSL